MRKLKHVAQKRRTDCGVACIQILTGVSESKARAALGMPKGARSDRTDVAPIRAALAKLGHRMGREVYCDEWDELASRVDRALVAVNYREATYTWHWIVFDNADPHKPLLDPQRTARRGVNSRTRVCTYYRVSPHEKS